MPAGATAVAVYTPESYTVTVQSTPLTGVASVQATATAGRRTTSSIRLSSPEKSVNLQAPATDPTGYTFSQWTLNGLSQGAGQKTVVDPRLRLLGQLWAPALGNSMTPRASP